MTITLTGNTQYYRYMDLKLRTLLALQKLQKMTKSLHMTPKITNNLVADKPEKPCITKSLIDAITKNDLLPIKSTDPESNALVFKFFLR